MSLSSVGLLKTGWKWCWSAPVLHWENLGAQVILWEVGVLRCKYNESIVWSSVFSKHSDLASCCCIGSFAVGRFFCFSFFVVGFHSLFSPCLETPWIPEYYLVPWRAGAVDLILIFFFLAIKSCFILPASTESGLLCVSLFEKRCLWVQSTPGCGGLKGYYFILFLNLYWNIVGLQCVLISGV